MSWFTNRYGSRVHRLELEVKGLKKKNETLESKIKLTNDSLSVLRREITKLFDVTTKQGNLDRDLIDKLISSLQEIRLGVTAKDLNG